MKSPWSREPVPGLRELNRKLGNGTELILALRRKVKSFRLVTGLNNIMPSLHLESTIAGNVSRYLAEFNHYSVGELTQDFVHAR